MHIAEGVLSAPVLAAGAAGAAVAVAYGLRKIDPDRMMTAALAGSVFFVASLIHVPVGFSSAHLIMNALAGILLGWAAIPVIFVSLLLQGLLMGFGGVTVLGVNTLTMGLSAVAAGWLFRTLARDGQARPLRLATASFAAGVCGVFLAGFLTACALAFSEEGFRVAAAGLFIAHIPIMAAEGILMVFIIRTLSRARPELLSGGFFRR